MKCNLRINSKTKKAASKMAKNGIICDGNLEIDFQDGYEPCQECVPYGYSVFPTYNIRCTNCGITYGTCSVYDVQVVLQKMFDKNDPEISRFGGVGLMNLMKEQGVLIPE